MDLQRTTDEAIRSAVSGTLGCDPTPRAGTLVWVRRDGAVGLLSAALRSRESSSGWDLELTLGLVTDAALPLSLAWGIAAKILEETDRTALPVTPTRDDDGHWHIAARLSILPEPLDLPRVQRLMRTLETLDGLARQLQQNLPATRQPAREVKIPSRLAGLLQAHGASYYRDSGSGSIAPRIAQHLAAGLPVAVVGSADRVRLELSRLTRMTGLVELHRPVPITELARLVQDLQKEVGAALAVHVSLLRPKLSIYEAGREVDAMFNLMRGLPSPIVFHGTRAELETSLAIGQGRRFDPRYPIIETLPPANRDDLIRCIFAQAGIANADPVGEAAASLVLQVTDNDDLLMPLANLVKHHGCGSRDLAAVLTQAAKTLAECRDTPGVANAAKAEARPTWLQQRLRERLCERTLEELLSSKLLGQLAATHALDEWLWMETVSRPAAQPMCVMLAGPPGTGKSEAAKLVAEYLGLEHHTINAPAFDAAHAVKTTLAGASRGIVGSFEEGVLERMSRQPAIVEIADIDHTPLDVRAALSDFFLDVLQRGVLQTGAGAVVTTLPQVIFIFTSNVAWGGDDSAAAGFGFQTAALTRDQTCERVKDLARRDFGPAFVSRVGNPIIFHAFDRTAAIEIARREAVRLMMSATGAAVAVMGDEVAALLIDEMPNFRDGARGVMEMIRHRLAPALRTKEKFDGKAVEVVLVDGRRIRIVGIGG